MLPSIEKWKNIDLLNDKNCEIFRKHVFPLKKHISLNPGTLGIPSQYVQTSIQNFYKEDIYAYPLQIYQQGRHYLKKSREIAQTIWPNKEYEVSFSLSSSNLINLLCIHLVSYLTSTKNTDTVKQQINILTSTNEHIGGLAFFQRHPSCKISYLHQEISSIPDIIFLSYISYNLAEIQMVQSIIQSVKKVNPNVIFILDVAQALGLYPFSFLNADFIIASTHKWLFGPYGLGILFFKPKVIDWIPALNYNGEYLDTDYKYANYELSGGQDFSSYAGLYIALKLFHTIKVETILNKSSFLCAFMASELYKIYQKKHINIQIYGKNGEVNFNELENPSQYVGFFSIQFSNQDPYPIYQSLNNHHIHVKCIKNTSHNLLRIGLPYYETIKRLKKVLQYFKD